ncbi:inorganic phosphate transporter [Halorientalis sp.]|uniref:inorganic phosphate transporter n=1 Tax=Halorientalis sp. TaxID=1931229 RepID=UPI002633AD11|nr:inorganic phosphate transporter [Halorientalis sp.]
MVSALLLVGLLVAVFVGFNIGGSSTGVAFGPAVGAGTVSKVGAAVLMTAFALLGGVTVGTEVVRTLGGQLVPRNAFTLTASIAVLFFIGFALFLSNVVGVPASTSMTAVGAIAGLGLAQGNLNWAEIGEIVSWWLFAPVLAFWVCGVIGRYFYPRLVESFAISQSEGALLTLDRSGTLPWPALGPGTTRREFLGTVLVVGIGCYMAFSAGASNVANAVAPLVGSGALGLYDGVLLGGAAIGLGAFTIARRTMDTVGNDLTDLPILAALVVAVVSSTLVTALSALGVPASFVIIATMSIVGLGWGRATRTATIGDAVRGEQPAVSTGALAAESDDAPTVGGEGGTPDVTEHKAIGEEEPDDLPAASDLFEPATTGRVLLLQNIVPAIATVASYLLFRFVPVF